MKTMPNGNINLIGFSLTGFGEGSSFGKLLEKILTDGGWTGEVREISYGGLSVNALAALIETAATPVKSGDIVALELATSFYSLHKYTLDQARPLVLAIANYFAKQRDVYVFFLNLFRADLDDNDCIVQAIREASALFQIPVLDLKPKYRAMFAGETAGTTDGIHPDLALRGCIAADIVDFLLAGGLPLPTDVGYSGPAYQLFDFCKQDLGREIFEYDGRGKVMRAVIVPANESIEIVFDRPEYIVGFCFLYGPETGFISLVADEQEPVELITFDENSYYRRVGFRPVELTATRILIDVLAKVRDMQLVRKSNLPTRSRCDFLCGLVLKV